MMKKVIALTLFLSIYPTHTMYFRNIIKFTTIKNQFKNFSNLRTNPVQKKILNKTTALFALAGGICAYNVATASAEEKTLLEENEQQMPASVFLKKRPQEVQQAVDQAFEENKYAKDEWFRNGTPWYGILGIDEEMLIKHLVSLGKKDIYIMDVGCGQGNWGQNIKEIVDTKYKNSNITFHIFSITGGVECQENQQKSDNVIFYQLNQFKIENINEELTKRGFDLKNKIDLIVTRWTLRHLVDPFGTVERLYELLTPTGGKLLSNGFLFKLDSSKEVRDFPVYHEYIIAHSNATVLFRDYDISRDRNQFLLERNDERPLNLPLHYTRSIDHIDGYSYQCASNKITEFQLADNSIINNSIEKLDKNAHFYRYCFKGDEQCKKLHTRLKEEGLFTPWQESSQ